MTTTTESRTWANVDAGPRQIKDLKKAMSELRWEGKCRDELTGVIGGQEHRFTSALMIGGQVRAEVAALEAEIMDRYDGKVTRANVRDIIADYEAAMPGARKSRPVDDNRRTPGEEAERNAASAARDAEYRDKHDAEAALLAQVMAKAPSGAKALIFAEYHEDRSDIQTDYFNSVATRTVAIGFRHSSREDFRALRSAAGQFPETAHLASEEALAAWRAGSRINGYGERLEHRDNHSMGAGNYLSDHGWAGSGTGWLVKSRDFPCAYVTLTEDAIPHTPATPEGGNGFFDQHGNWIPQRMTPGNAVTVSPSSLGREGVVEIRFAERPGDDVLAGLKAHGFRWARANRCWYGSDTAYAGTLVSEARS